MLIMITGTPGAGKTLYTVQMIVKYLKDNEKLIAEGKAPRLIFARIDGIDIPGVRPAPEDWRKAPKGSVIIYDEAQQIYPPDSKGRSQRSDIADLEVHRHDGYDIIMITQHPTLVHSHVRKLVGRHFHIERVDGKEASRVYRKDKMIQNIDSEQQLRQCDSDYWTFPKELYGKYDSAEVHNSSTYFPVWLRKSLGALIVSALIIGFSAVYAWDFFVGSHTGFADDTAPVSESVPSGGLSKPVDSIEPAFVHTPDHALDGRQYSVQKQGCIVSKTKCQCYDNAGWLMELEDYECRNEINKPYQQLLRSQDNRRDYSSSSETSEPPPSVSG